MATIMPEGDAIRKAVKWISAELEVSPGESPMKFVNQAVVKFDLSPKETEFLMEFYRKQREQPGSEG
ncbi:hypothetical protein [Desulforhabdus sp. TSK]|uniref:hypothetical protein n=1 Tax=Desulforhabdus sp. TSK TaxID=2925014 RepID=UPI001FC86CB0|nr:hypothetical protein [Desulforhabdus sp. TSK]GKT07525.1 hypothetical protein DSTSK_08300 [Desulforhabdus sp. TSK]